MIFLIIWRIISLNVVSRDIGNMETEQPQVITLSDSEIEITFPNWVLGRQYLYLNQWPTHDRLSEQVVKVRI